jgi:antitoxin component YwqK of YwqJK toxin-antitoxin module
MIRTLAYAFIGLTLVSSVPVSADPAPATATANVQDEVAAHSFRLVDKNGKTTLLITNGDDDKSPTLVLYDAKGQARIAIAVDTGQTPLVGVYDPEGKVRLTAGYDNDQKSPEIAEFDPTGTQRSIISLINGNPVMGVYYKDGAAAASMEIDDDIANVTVMGKDNKTAMFAKPSGDVGTAIYAKDTARGYLGLDSGIPSLTLGSATNGNIALVGADSAPYLAIADQNATRLKISLDKAGAGKIDFNDKSGTPSKSLP